MVKRRQGGGHGSSERVEDDVGMDPVRLAIDHQPVSGYDLDHTGMVCFPSHKAGPLGVLDWVPGPGGSRVRKALGLN